MDAYSRTPIHIRYDWPRSAPWQRATLPTGRVAAHRPPIARRSQAEQWELPRHELAFIGKIGVGRGGVAYHCSWRGLDCMAKMLIQDTPEGGNAELSQRSQSSQRSQRSAATPDQTSPEWADMITELSTISHLRHPNLVRPHPCTARARAGALQRGTVRAPPGAPGGAPI